MPRTPARIVILAVGSAGDVYPFIVIGAALRARGHDVTLVASDNFRERVERAGLGFVSGLAQHELDAGIADPDLWHPVKGFATIWKHMARHLPAAYAQQCALVLGPERPAPAPSQAEPVTPTPAPAELLAPSLAPSPPPAVARALSGLQAARGHGQPLVIASTLGLTGRLLQEAHGVPLMTVHLAPSCLFSVDDTAARRGLRWPRNWPRWAVRWTLSLIDRAMVDRVVQPAINDLRAALGLAPVAHVMSRWLHSPQRVVCAWPAWFAAPQADWPANAVCVGFPRMPAASERALAPALQAFIDAGTAPVVITPGSAMAHGRHFIARALGAVQAAGARAVVVTPYRDQLPAHLPPSVHYIAYAPFDLLSRQAAAFVHHGGIGTSATVLAAGKPQLIVPFAFDQPDNAARLTRLGVALTVLPDARQSVWNAALARLLDDPAIATACTVRATVMAGEAPAAETIADLAEALLYEQGREGHTGST